MLHLLRFIFVIALSIVGLGLAYLGATHPDSPLPRAYNPAKRLFIDDPVTFLTDWKLRAAVGDVHLCRAALSDDRAGFRIIADRVETEQCHIRDGVELSAIGGLAMRPVQTRCDIALRLAMWERHGLQPAAREFLGAQVTRIQHFSSYSCRVMRTGRGRSTTMSTHATASAIDVAGFDLSDGRRLVLKSDWAGGDAGAAFLRAVRDSSCRWFATTLGPDYNALHADHFHLQADGWGTCR